MGMRKYGTAPDQRVLPEEGDGAAEVTETPELVDPVSKLSEQAEPITYGLPHPRSVGQVKHPNDY